MYCNICIRRINTYFNILFSNILHILFTPIYFSVTLATPTKVNGDFISCDLGQPWVEKNLHFIFVCISFF